LTSKQWVAILPVGSTEQHGPHLPTGTDTIIARSILDRALASLAPLQSESAAPEDSVSMGLGTAVVLPAVSYGASFEHASFPGTIPVRDNVLNGLWLDIIRGVLTSTPIRKVLLVNGHGGNTPNVQAVVRAAAFNNGRLDGAWEGAHVGGGNNGEMDADSRGGGAFGTRNQSVGGLNALVAGCEVQRMLSGDGVVCEEELKYGLHGGAVETGAMRILSPELLREDFISNFPSRESAEVRRDELTAHGDAVCFGWRSEWLNAHGAVGNATLGTAAVGNVVVDRAVSRLARLVQEMVECEVSEVLEPHVL